MTKEAIKTNLNEILDFIKFAGNRIPTKHWSWDNEKHDWIESLNEVIGVLEQESCEDAISRKEALDMATSYPTDGWDMYTPLVVDVEAIEELPSVTPQQRWMPVSERLPNRDEYIKNNGLFNVTDGNRSYSEWFDIYDKQRFGEPTTTGFRIDYAVTAWMPLPEPYKAESEEQ